MPATSVSALLSSMRGLNYLSANLVPLCDGNTGGVRVIQEFNIAELVQTIADQLSAELAQVEVELVILQSDTGPKPTYLVGDREGMGYVLAHVSELFVDLSNPVDHSANTGCGESRRHYRGGTARHTPVSINDPSRLSAFSRGRLLSTVVVAVTESDIIISSGRDRRVNAVCIRDSAQCGPGSRPKSGHS